MLLLCYYLIPNSRIVFSTSESIFLNSSLSIGVRVNIEGLEI